MNRDREEPTKEMGGNNKEMEETGAMESKKVFPEGKAQGGQVLQT